MVEQCATSDSRGTTGKGDDLSEKGIARESSAYGGQAMPLLNDNQAAPVNPQIDVIKRPEQIEHNVIHSPPPAQRRVYSALGN